MITRIIIISLICTALHVCAWEGMLLHRSAEWVGVALDKCRLSILRKPLYECLMCMGGIYTLILDPILFGWSWWVLADMLCVIGLNTLISAAICHMQE